MINYTSKIILYLLFITSVSGCYPDSVRPLIDTMSPLVDESLSGVWCWKDKSESGYIHIGKDRNNNLRIVLIEHRDTEMREVINLVAQTSKLGNDNVLNIKYDSVSFSETQEKLFEGYLLFKYMIHDNILSISSLDKSFIETVQSKVKTTVMGKGSRREKIALNDSFDNINNVIMSNEINVFNKKTAIYWNISKGCYEENKYLHKPNDTIVQ